MHRVWRVWSVCRVHSECREETKKKTTHDDADTVHTLRHSCHRRHISMLVSSPSLRLPLHFGAW